MRTLKFLGLVMTVGLMMATYSFSQPKFSTPFTFIPGISANVDDGGCVDFRCEDRTYCGHCGTDFLVGLGTPTYAAANGYVTQINTGCPYGYYCDQCGGGFGNFVKMRASVDSSWTFIVAHLSAVYLGVGAYSDCNNGPMLGRSGSSGCSTGPHTHFQVYHYGWCQGDDPYRGYCGGDETFWICQEYNGEICSNDCQ